MTRQPRRLAFGQLKVVAVITLLFYGSSGYAQNLGFLMNTPISYMKERDLEQLNQSAGVALNTKADGQTLEWNNKGTGNSVSIHGTITPSDTVKEGGQTCRKLAIVAQAKGQSQTWSPVACKTGAEKWKLKKQ